MSELLDDLARWLDGEEELAKLYQQSLATPREVMTNALRKPQGVVTGDAHPVNSRACVCGHAHDEHYPSLRSCILCNCHEYAEWH